MSDVIPAKAGIQPRPATASSSCTASPRPTASGTTAVPVLRGVDLDGAARRIARRRRRLGLRQEHAAAPAGRARSSDVGIASRCWARISTRSARRAQGELAQSRARLRLPVPPPAAGVLGARERGDAAHDPPRAASARRPSAPRRCWRKWASAHRLAHRPGELSGRRAPARGRRARARHRIRRACSPTSPPATSIARTRRRSSTSSSS